MLHYIGMAGMTGCIPNYCQSHTHREHAIDDLVGMHDLEPFGEEHDNLVRDGFTLLPNDAGNEYCEVMACDCDTPEVHNDH